MIENDPFKERLSLTEVEEAEASGYRFMNAKRIRDVLIERDCNMLTMRIAILSLEALLAKRLAERDGNVVPLDDPSNQRLRDSVALAKAKYDEAWDLWTECASSCEWVLEVLADKERLYR
jgi:hypothetical protein